MASRSDVIEVLDLLASSFRDDKLDETAVRSWALAFRSTPRLMLARHAMLWIQTEQWMPKIGQLMRRVQNNFVAFEESSFTERTRRNAPPVRSNWLQPSNPRDEAEMWLCFCRGCDPDELSEKDLAEIRAPVC